MKSLTTNIFLASLNSDHQCSTTVPHLFVRYTLPGMPMAARARERDNLMFPYTDHDIRYVLMT